MGKLFCNHSLKSRLTMEVANVNKYKIVTILIKETKIFPKTVFPKIIRSPHNTRSMGQNLNKISQTLHGTIPKLFNKSRVPMPINNMAPVGLF